MSTSKKYVLEFKGHEINDNDSEKFVCNKLKSLPLVNINPFEDELCEPEYYSLIEDYIVYYCDGVVSYFNVEIRYYDQHTNEWIRWVMDNCNEMKFNNLENVNYKTLCDGWWTNKIDIFRYKILDLI